jgi:hypothetical protein
LKSPTNLLTVFSAVNRHTAYMDSFVRACHALTTCWEFLCVTASPETQTSCRKHQQHQGCWLGNSGIRTGFGIAAGRVREATCEHLRKISHQHLANHMAFHICQSTLDAVVLKRQFLMIEAQQMKDRGVQVVKWMNVLHGS